MADKPNCYKCKYRGTIPGDCHSQCRHPSVKEMGDPITALCSMLGGKQELPTPLNNLGIKGSEHGIRHGWFNWPYNFDPIWLEECNGFEDKEG